MLSISSFYTAFPQATPLAAVQGSPQSSTQQSRSRDVRDTVNLSNESLVANREIHEKPQTINPNQKSAEESAVALTAEELKQLSKLKNRDREVKAHEQAHLSVAGQYASGSASYTLQRGPDGNSYAVGGEVPIDISSESTPEATLQKMRTVRRAALAPAEPSGADRQIAAQASAKELQARQEIAAKLQEDLNSVLSSSIGSKQVADQKSTAVSSETPPQQGSQKMMIAAYQSQIQLA